LGNLKSKFPRSASNDAEIKSEGVFLFYKWLLSGISIAEHKRILNETPTNESVAEEDASINSSRVQEYDARKERRLKFNVNIQTFGKASAGKEEVKSPSISLLRLLIIDCYTI